MKLVSEDLVEDHIFRAAKEILFHLRIGLFELGDQIFGLEALGTYRIRYMGRISSIPSKLVLRSLGIMA